MSTSEKLDDCKKVIRSLLIAYQKGCYLTEFNRAYRDLIGTKLPSKEFNFRTDIDFLMSMPDVVRVTPVGTNLYHLQGIADEKSKHIQKMVCKQKPAKLKGPPPPRTRLRVYTPSRNVEVAPRFREPPHKINRSIFSENTDNYKNYDNSSNSARKLTEATSQYYDNSSHSARKLIEANSQNYDNSSNSARKLTEAISVSSQKTPREEMISLVKSFKEGVAVSDLLFEYEKRFHKSFSLEKYGFESIEECLQDIPEFKLIQIRNESYVIHESDALNVLANDTVKETQKIQMFSSSTNDLQNYAEKLETHWTANSSTLNSDYSGNQNDDLKKLPDSIYQKFVKVIKKYSQGIWASDFPSRFEEVNNTTFDLHSLGYNCLADCIDDYSDIFIRKHVAGSKKSYIIYPAYEFSSDFNAGALLIDHIILNIRKILEAYSEGVKLQDFLHIYSINCKDSLHVQELGFRDLETFLTSIKDNVPLRFESVSGVKTIFLTKMSDTRVELLSPPPFVCDEEAIPFDAAFPDFQFKTVTLPPDFDYKKYFPVFVSSVAHPGHLYIQLDNDDTDEIVKAADKMDEFYKGTASGLYTMKNAHIKVGAACVALWLGDQVWYRARIVSIPSMDNVEVFYVDYGTRDTVPKHLLRYIRKEYANYPAAALKCRLAYLRPLNKASTWDSVSGKRLLNMCADIPLMAKIEETLPNGMFSILLCDTNGDTDVYINDALHNEGIADYIDEDNSAIPLSPEPNTSLTITKELPDVSFHCQEETPENSYLHPLQALQAQYFLHAFATVAPNYAQSEPYKILLRWVSMFCTNTDPVIQNQSLPVIGAPSSVIAAPSANILQPNMSTISGTNLSYLPTLPTFDTNPLNESPIRRPKANTAFSPETSSDAYLETADFDRYASAKSTLAPFVEGKNCDSEIFEDDDDEVFQQFCQQVSSTKLRYVKRVMLGDGYKIHVIAYDSKPYASSGDIAGLIWNNKEADYLFRRLHSKYPEIPILTLSEDGNEELFHQLDRYNVKGVQKTSGFKASVLLYSLSVVIKILNIFGHPSVSLRTKLTEEIANFNPNDDVWKEFSASEISEPDEEENHVGVTDDDKIEKLCLFDLLAMKEGIKLKRMKILSTIDNSDSANYADEISKLEQMHNKVLQRINEIKEICSLFA